MNPKYIIAGNRVTGKGYLRMGRVVNHKDLVVGYEHVWGGGWWERNDNEKPFGDKYLKMIIEI